MTAIDKILTRLSSLKTSHMPIEALANQQYRDGFIKALALAEEEISNKANELHNDPIIDILNGLSDWWYSEAPINDEPETETFKVLKKVIEYIETYLEV